MQNHLARHRHHPHHTHCNHLKTCVHCGPASWCPKTISGHMKAADHRRHSMVSSV
nr:MAG TPA: hypothetical protein [Caudoviricetes sp.]